MSTHTTPEYRCPACHQPLKLEDVPGSKNQFMYCGYGSCPSYEMNDGIEGQDLFDMHKQLEDIWTDEKMEREDTIL